ncbi:MAG: CNNM domain-containing protein, partial [Negativicoccus succinicivorans]|nr:CNNM domain-containing protein [Negativicoccus succinicivorans]
MNNNMFIAHLLTPWGAFWSILAVLFLMMATILVIAKYSFIRLRREYVQELAAEEEEPNWSRISSFYASPNRYLGTIQWVLLVVTLLYYYSIYQCWMLLTPPTIQWLWGEWILSLVVLLVAVTLFWIVADLIPKAVALQNALK